eukprot:CCRYP_001066-RA/>CCRYP_001066-RA protein AED:0.45 eAED:0.70 QI:0/0/0/1/0/0/2/0/164
MKAQCLDGTKTSPTALNSDPTKDQDSVGMMDCQMASNLVRMMVDRLTVMRESLTADCSTDRTEPSWAAWKAPCLEMMKGSPKALNSEPTKDQDSVGMMDSQMASNLLGCMEGSLLGDDEGLSKGIELGTDEGSRLGWDDGLSDGIELGSDDGSPVGCDEGVSDG